MLSFVARSGAPMPTILNRYLNVLHETDRQIAAAVRDDPARRARAGHARRGHRRSRPGVRRSARQLHAGADGVRGRRQRAAAALVSAPLSGARRAQPRSAATSIWRRRSPTSSASRPRPTGRAAACSTAGHPPRAYFYVAEDHFTLGVREENWKYIFDLREGAEELYDLGAGSDRAAQSRRGAAGALRAPAPAAGRVDRREPAALREGRHVGAVMQLLRQWVARCANRLKKLVSFHFGRSVRLAMRTARSRTTSTYLPAAARSTG